MVVGSGVCAVSFRTRRTAARSGHDRREEAHQPGRKGFHAHAFEQVGAVFDRAVEPGRRAASRTVLGEPNGEIEFGARGHNRLEAGGQPRQLEIRGRLVLQG